MFVPPANRQTGVVLTGLLEGLFTIFILKNDLATVSDTSVRRQASTEVLIKIKLKITNKVKDRKIQSSGLLAPSP